MKPTKPKQQIHYKHEQKTLGRNRKLETGAENSKQKQKL